MGFIKIHDFRHSWIFHGGHGGPIGTPWGRHGEPMGSHGTYGDPWETMGPHGDPWGPIGTHGDPWEPMGTHGNPVGRALLAGLKQNDFCASTTNNVLLGVQYWRCSLSEGSKLLSVTLRALLCFTLQLYAR